MKRLLPFILLTSLLLSACGPLQTTCKNLWETGGQDACLQNTNCKTILGGGEGYNCGGNGWQGSCQKPITVIGCEKMPKEKINMNQKIRDLCIKTGGVPAPLDIFGRIECTCKNTPIPETVKTKEGYTAPSEEFYIAQSMGIIEGFDEIKGCISQKTICEKEKGVWEDTDYYGQDILIRDKDTCATTPGRKWFLDGNGGSCIITNRSKYDDRFGGCVMGGKRYTYNSGQWHERS